MDTAPPKQSIATLAAISMGLALAASCFPLLATIVAQLGPWAAPAIAGCGLLAWLVSRLYAELAAAWPTAAGVRVWVGHAFGDRAGLWTALLYLFLVVALGASESFILSRLLAVVIPGLPALPVCVGFIALCGAVNAIGLELTGRVQNALTGSMLVGLAAIAVLAIVWGAPPSRAALEGIAPVALGLPAAVFLFVGFEWVTSAVEEADPEGRALPRAMSWSIAGLVATYALCALGLWSALSPAELLAGPTQHLTLGASVGGTAGLWAMLVLSVLATVTSFNAGILGASRLLYALAREGVAPRPLARLHGRFLTPALSIAAIGTVTALSAALLSTSGAVQIPILVGAAIECMVYAAVALAFARLRATKADRPRPYRAFLGPWSARALAVVSLGVGAGCIAGAGEHALVAGCVLLAALAITGARALTFRPPAPRKRAPARELVEVR